MIKYLSLAPPDDVQSVRCVHALCVHVCGLGVGYGFDRSIDGRSIEAFSPSNDPNDLFIYAPYLHIYTQGGRGQPAAPGGAQAVATVVGGDVYKESQHSDRGGESKINRLDSAVLRLLVFFPSKTANLVHTCGLSSRAVEARPWSSLIRWKSVHGSVAPKRSSGQLLGDASVCTRIT